MFLKYNCILILYVREKRFRVNAFFFQVSNNETPVVFIIINKTGSGEIVYRIFFYNNVGPFIIIMCVYKIYECITNCRARTHATDEAIPRAKYIMCT